jgi:hypothetical protein
MLSCLPFNVIGIADFNNLGHCGGHFRVSEVYLSRKQRILVERRSRRTLNHAGV